MSMPHARHDLLNVLDLLAGKLPAEDGIALRQRLAEDEELRDVWRRVSDAWHETADPAGGVATSEYSPEQIGALLEGRLSPAETASIGDACRHDPALLEEVVAAYRLRNLAMGVEQVPDRLTRRLLALQTLAPTGAGPVAETGPRRREHSVGNGRSHATGHADHRPPRVHGPTAKSGGRASVHRAIRSQRAVVAVAVAAVVLGVSLWAAWHLGRTRGPGPEQGVTRNGDSSGASREPRVIDEHHIGRAPDPLPVSAPEQGVVRNRVDPPPMRQDAPLVPPPVTSEAPAPSSPEAVVDVQWEQILGLVAVAGPGTDDWRGAQAPRAPTSSITLASLPGSWAVGRISGLGEFVLAGDTRVTWSQASRPEGAMRVAVDSGRCALRGLASGTSLVSQDGRDESPIKVTEPGTVIVLDQTDGARQIAVLAGAADISGTSVRRRQFVSWTSGGWSAPRAFDNPPTWVANPEAAASMDTATQEELLASDDLLATLSDLDASAPTQTRSTLVGWRLSLAPEATILASLRSSSESTRAATVAWLIDDRPADPSQALAWQTFAQELSDPEIARSLRRWTQLASGGRAPTRNDLGELLAGLDHTELGVRQFAQTCLERITGRRAPAYRADGSDSERQAGIRQWRGIIVRNPAGRRGANQRVPRPSQQTSLR